MKGAALLRKDSPRAETYLRKAVTLDPGQHASWFDLGLLYKWTRRWNEAFDCNLRAAELVGEQRDEPAWWNLGIAATALHRWDVARRAWRAYGLPIDDGDGEIDGNFGYNPVRLNPDADGEVVWGRRIDPARIRLESVPFPSSGHRWGDVVLHDGEPKGYRTFWDQSAPVFDELERWRPSEVPTIDARVAARSVDDVDRLLSTIDAAGFTTEDWTRNVRRLCHECSQGHPDGDHAHPPDMPEDGEHVVGIAAPFDLATSIIRQWEQDTGGTCRIVDVL